MIQFSIIIPVYNVRCYIHRTIASVLTQTYKNYEIIVIDDGSTDGSGELVSTLSNGRNDIIKVISQKNSGVSSARNAGINIARGEYLVFLDGDDYLESNYLEEFYRIVKQNKYDLVFCCYDKVDENCNVISFSPFSNIKSKYLSKQKILKYFFIDNMILWTGCVAYKKDLILGENIKFNVSLSYAEDQDFTTKVLYHANQINFTKKVLVHYLQRQTSVVNNVNLVKVRDNIKAYRFLKYYFQYVICDSKTTRKIKYIKLPQKVISVLTTYAKQNDAKHFDSLLSRKAVRKYIIIYVLMNIYNPKCFVRIFVLLFFTKQYFKFYSKNKFN